MIDINKKYTFEGFEVKILEIFDGKVFFRAKVNSGNWVCDSMSVELSINKLKEVNKYTDFKIDDKVIVWHNGSDVKFRRYFAGVDERGNAKAYEIGCTSWSAGHNKPVSWGQCIKAEDFKNENI